MFWKSYWHGKDFDGLHPTCVVAANSGCVPKPPDRDRLQIMPWPDSKELTDTEARAVYEYLRAVPASGEAIQAQADRTPSFHLNRRAAASRFDRSTALISQTICRAAPDHKKKSGKLKNSEPFLY